MTSSSQGIRQIRCNSGSRNGSVGLWNLSGSVWNLSGSVWNLSGSSKRRTESWIDSAA